MSASAQRYAIGAKMTIKDSLCDWTLTAEQMEVPEHQFCFQVSFFLNIKPYSQPDRRDSKSNDDV